LAALKIALTSAAEIGPVTERRDQRRRTGMITTRDDDHTALPTVVVADAAMTAAGNARVVLCLIDDGRDPAFRYARRAAASLTAHLGVRLVLSDRTRESWAMTPHVVGPATLKDVERRGDTHLVSQIREARALGVRDVLAVAPTNPSPDAVGDAVETVGADVVVIPERYDRPKPADHLFLGGTSLERAIAERVRVRVLVAHPDGHVTLARHGGRRQ
jgi:hypothetical protein